MAMNMLATGTNLTDLINNVTAFLSGFGVLHVFEVLIFYIICVNI